MPGFLLEARLMRCSFDGLENDFNLQGLNDHLLITLNEKVRRGVIEQMMGNNEN